MLDNLSAGHNPGDVIKNFVCNRIFRLKYHSVIITNDNLNDNLNDNQLMPPGQNAIALSKTANGITVIFLLKEYPSFPG